MKQEQVAALLSVDDELLAVHPQVYGADRAERCRELAFALASSPAWERLRGGAHLVVRADAGLIGVLGRVDSEARPLVDALGWQVESLLRRLRPVGYPEVERLCFTLADVLRAQLSPSQLRGCSVVGAPRGGLIVAGLLSYALGLSSEQAAGSATRDGITLLVDDCALSGTRLRQQLTDLAAPEALVVHLHSHPALRRRVEEIEEGVVACLAAEDLEDHAPGRSDYDAWRRRWAERLPDEYWTGDPEHVCYPWNEPDALVWNPAISQAQPGWRVIPPAWCIKNRAESRLQDVQECSTGEGELQLGDAVLWADADDAVLLAAAGHPNGMLLRDTAASMWRAVIQWGAADLAAAAVAEAYDVEVRRVRGDLDRFVDELVNNRLLRTH